MTTTITATDIQFMWNVLKSLGLAMPRIFTIMILVPVFASSVLPRAMRAAMAVALALPVVYGMAPTPVGDGILPLYIGLLCKETAVGLVLGFILAVPFWAMQAVGVMLDNERGATAGQMATPFSQPDESVIGAALQQSLVIFLVHTGGLIALYKLLLMSFDVWPVLQLIPDFSHVRVADLFKRFSEFFGLVLLYASPLIASLLLIDFGFAWIGVFSPQLQVYSAVRPIKSLAGIFILALYLSILLQHGSNYFQRVLVFESSFLKPGAVPTPNPSSMNHRPFAPHSHQERGWE